MIKRLFKNLTVLIVTIIICLIGLEMAVRVIYPKVSVSALDKEMFIKDDLLGYKLKPNVNVDKIILSLEYITRSNAAGLRNDTDYDYESHPDVLKILGLGDSVAYGSGVKIEETYLKVVESKLNKALLKRAKEAQVINAAFPGWGIAQELLFLKSEGLKYMPDIVLVGFVADDIYRNGRYYETALNYKLKSEHKEKLKVLGKSQLEDLNLVHNFLLNKTQLYPLLLAKFSFFRNRHYIDHALKLTQDVFLEMQRVCSQNKIELLVAVMPLRQRENQINTLMINFFNDKGIKAIDLRDDFSKVEGELFLPNDNHPNPRGHQLIADNIYKYLVEN